MKMSLSRAISNSKSTSNKIKINARKMRFKIGKNTDKAWHNESPFLSFFWSAASTAFPDGELFFMNSGRYYKDRINNPTLEKQLDEFLKQEAHHTVQHKRFNRVMRDKGFDIDKYEGWFAAGIADAKKHLSHKAQLSVSVALEHFTASFANHYLTKDYLTEGMDPDMKALWTWHAMEELEHKGVLYDLYQEIEGDYLTRVMMMPPAWAGLLGITFYAQFDMLRQDGKLLDIKNNAKGMWYVFIFLTSLTPEFLRYFKPNFHPWDTDNHYLITQWEEANKEHLVTDLTAA